MGEQPMHIRQSDQNPGTLKEELKAILPQIEEMRKRKSERRNQFGEVLEQIQKISSEIQRAPSSTSGDETDLSLRKLEELHRELEALQKEKSDRLKQVLELLNNLNSLCLVLGVEFKQTVSEVHTSLSCESEGSKNISNHTIEQLGTAIQRLREVKLHRMQRLQDLGDSMWELWNLMNTPLEEQPRFQTFTCNIAASEHEINEPNMLSVEFMDKVEVEVSRLEELKARKMKEDADHEVVNDQFQEALNWLCEMVYLKKNSRRYGGIQLLDGVNIEPWPNWKELEAIFTGFTRCSTKGFGEMDDQMANNSLTKLLSFEQLVLENDLSRIQVPLYSPISLNLTTNDYVYVRISDHTLKDHKLEMVVAKEVGYPPPSNITSALFSENLKNIDCFQKWKYCEISKGIRCLHYLLVLPWNLEEVKRKRAFTLNSVDAMVVRFFQVHDYVRFKNHSSSHILGFLPGHIFVHSLEGSFRNYKPEMVVSKEVGYPPSFGRTINLLEYYWRKRGRCGIAMNTKNDQLFLMAVVGDCGLLHSHPISSSYYPAKLTKYADLGVKPVARNTQCYWEMLAVVNSKVLYGNFPALSIEMLMMWGNGELGKLLFFSQGASKVASAPSVHGLAAKLIITSGSTIWKWLLPRRELASCTGALQTAVRQHKSKEEEQVFPLLSEKSRLKSRHPYFGSFCAALSGHVEVLATQFKARETICDRGWYHCFL